MAARTGEAGASGAGYEAASMLRTLIVRVNWMTITDAGRRCLPSRMAPAPAAPTACGRCHAELGPTLGSRMVCAVCGIIGTNAQLD
jgi:hypothetical protein